MDETISGALSGLVVGAASQVVRASDDQDRRLRNVTLDHRDLEREFRGLLVRGEILRSRYPSVQDFQVGLALASPNSPEAQVVPTQPTKQRPNIATAVAAEAGKLTWPVKIGDYDERGWTRQAGDMGNVGFALTTEELRMVLLSVVQPQQPTPEQQIQINRAISTLIAKLYANGSSPVQTLTAADYANAWHRLFFGGPHEDPGNRPTLTTIDANLTSAALTDVPTDEGMIVALKVGANPINALADLARIKFSTPFSHKGLPARPVVVASTPFVASQIGADGFVLQSRVQLQPTEVYEAHVLVRGPR